MEFRQTTRDDARAISEFYLSNSDHLSQWEPRRIRNYHSVGSWKERLAQREHETAERRSVYFMSYVREKGEVVALCSLTNIVGGPFQACNIGYAVSKKYEGRGAMKQLCSYAIKFAFDELGLNRIMANYMPRNARSAVLLGSLGFAKEGMAKNYLQINGQWEDHILTALVNPKNI
ncbi:MAG: GNAT family N-acetyltransferase [Halioglobus sp.]|nr:GNAT family N-acetyltransferase [Halioglobus sp.]